MQKQLPLDCPILIREDESTDQSPQFADYSSLLLRFRSTVYQDLCKLTHFYICAIYTVNPARSNVIPVQRVPQISPVQLILVILPCCILTCTPCPFHSLYINGCFDSAILPFSALFIYLLFPCFLSVFLFLFPPSSARLCQGLGKSLV